MQAGIDLLRLLSLAAVVLIASSAEAGRLLPPGDVALRHDVQLLSDAGVLRGPVTTWPLAWGPILADLERFDRGSGWRTDIVLAAERLKLRGENETSERRARYRLGIAATEKPVRWRSFAETPRESGEVTAGVSWLGERLGVELNGQVVSSPEDGREFRADGSQVAALLGNYVLAVSTLNRWWGPGWDGSLVLSANARPLPAVTLDRVSTEPFESRWLRWLGPWDLSLMAAQMESDRVVPDAQFLGFRFNFRPLSSLEIGVTRTAQWCGEGRPCDADTFVDLLLGRDNRGDTGIVGDNEPGNQLAGIDFRWGVSMLGQPTALYGQFIGEDEAGGFPSKFLGQAGIEASGVLQQRWSWRGFFEIASTKCRFYRPDGDYNCAYNHGTYQSGYRYRGRAVGHGADNDALMFSTGLFLVDEEDTQWQVLARFGELNRGGTPDPRNSLSPIARDLASLDIVYGRHSRYGVIEVGAGVERLDSDTDGRAFVRWRTSP